MELVGVAAGGGDVPDGRLGGLHLLRRFGQPQADQELLGRTAHVLPEQLAEIAPVQLADVGDLLHGKLPAVVLLHKGDGLLDVEVLEPGAVELPPGGGGLDQPVQEQAQVPDQVEGGGLGVVGDVKHGVPHRLPLGDGLRAVDGLGQAESGGVQELLGPQAVKLHPGVFPGVVLVGIVGVHLPGADQKALVGPQVIVPGGPVGAVGVEAAPAGDDVVEQKVVADKGPEGVEGGALLPAVLEQPQVQKIFVGEHGEGVFVHRQPVLSRRGANPAACTRMISQNRGKTNPKKEMGPYE